MTDDKLERVSPADGFSFSGRKEEVGRPPATCWAAGNVAPDLKRDFFLMFAFDNLDVLALSYLVFKVCEVTPRLDPRVGISKSLVPPVCIGQDSWDCIIRNGNERS